MESAGLLRIDLLKGCEMEVRSRVYSAGDSDGGFRDVVEEVGQEEIEDPVPLRRFCRNPTRSRSCLRR